MTRRAALSAVLALLVAAAGLVGCGEADQPAATSCGGSDAWPPAAVAELQLPVGVDVQPLDVRSVRVRNLTDGDLRFDIVPWRLGPCVGWIEEETPVDRSLIGPDHEITYQDDPPPGVRTKLGVRIYEAGCDPSCTDPPIGFAWIDLAPVPLPPAS